MEPQKEGGTHGVVLSLLAPRAAEGSDGNSKSASFDLEKSAGLSARLRELAEKDATGGAAAPAAGSTTLREKVASLNLGKPQPAADPVMGALKQRIHALSATMTKSASDGKPKEPPAPASLPEEAKTPGNGEGLRAKLVELVTAHGKGGDA